MKRLKTAIKVTVPFVTGFVLSLSLRDVLEQSDFGNVLEKYIPTIPIWWDKGDMFPIHDIIDTGKVLHISDIVSKVGALALIVLAAVVIFKLTIKKPKKK